MWNILLTYALLAIVVFPPLILIAVIKLNQKATRIMSDLDTLLADVQAQKTQIDSVSTLLTSIKHQLADALSGETLSAGAKAKLALIMPQLEANTQELTDAINANTDAAPPVTADPTAVTSTSAPAVGDFASAPASIPPAS